MKIAKKKPKLEVYTMEFSIRLRMGHNRFPSHAMETKTAAIIKRILAVNKDVIGVDKKVNIESVQWEFTEGGPKIDE